MGANRCLSLATLSSDGLVAVCAGSDTLSLTKTTMGRSEDVAESLRDVWVLDAVCDVDRGEAAGIVSPRERGPRGMNKVGELLHGCDGPLRGECAAVQEVAAARVAKICDVDKGEEVDGLYDGVCVAFCEEGDEAVR